MRTIFSLAFLCLNMLAYAQSNQKDTSRYIEDSVLIKTRDGAFVSALFVRARSVTTPQPTVMMFTIYPRLTDVNRGRNAADHGYVGVVAYKRETKQSQ